MTTPRHRSSIFTGLLLILLGVIFLIQRLSPHLGIGHIIARYWPILLILWGIAKLVDYRTADRIGEGRPAILSPVEAALLVLVILVLTGFTVKDWIDRHNPDSDIDVGIFSEKATDSEQLDPIALPEGAHVTIANGRGKITAHAGDGNELRVGVNETASDSTESAARDRLKNFGIIIDKKDNEYLIHPKDAESSVSADLDVQLPMNVAVNASSKHGDFSLSGTSGPVTVALKDGDVEIHNVTSDVNVDVKHGDVRVSDMKGKLRITGKGTEIEINDLNGDAAIDGEFFGPIQIRNVTGSTHFASKKTDITLASLSGRLELDSGEIQIADVSGAAKIIAREKDIQIENATGRLDIQDSKGNVEVTYTNPPHEDINISNDTGGVDLTLPPRSSFTISATSRQGEAHNEFEDNGVQSGNDGGTGRLAGSVGSGHSKITISTSYGTIALHKSD